MDKRYEPLKEYGRVNKKPKLEIVVNKGRPNQNKAVPGPSRNAKLGSPDKLSPDDFWDDDDDEVILLASQVVEKEIPRGQTVQASMDFTFSEFAPNAKVTSTQKPFDVELFSELLDDDWGMEAVPEEQVFKVPSMAPLKRPYPAQPREASTVEKNSNDRPFSDLIKSSTPGFSQAYANGSEQPTNSAAMCFTQPPPGIKPNNREKAHECQIQFLQKRADILKKENTKIVKELDEFKNKMESKDGEVALLRDEIRHLKQQIQNALRDKLQRTDAAKGEWQEKINELSKQVEAQQTVLEFKTMEISKLKMHHGDESMRFEHSMRANETLIHQTKVSSVNRRRWTRLQSSALPNSKVPVICSVPMEIFDHSTQKSNSKFRKDVFHREMEQLQFQMSKLQYIGQMKQEQRSKMSKSVISSAKNVIAEFWSYVHTLEYNKHCNSLPYHEYDITKDRSSDKKQYSLFQAGELFPSEKAINLRRFIAGLALVCHFIPQVTDEVVFTTHNDEYLLIQIIVDALNKLGFSHEMHQHFGVLESFAMLLSIVLNTHAVADDEAHTDRLLDFLKTLIFCRPNAWTNKYITECFLKLPQPMKEQLCCNSDPRTFSVTQSTYKFTADTCILQVHAVLLEITFPVHQDLSGSQFKLLAEICYNHLSFFMNCFTDPPSFVEDIFPYEDDADFAIGSPQGRGNITCQCYVMMSNSVVRLLYQVMRQWQRMGRQQELKLVLNLSKVGIILLHTIYIRYYMTKLFDHKGYLTRHYLYFVCKYWLENMDTLGFTEMHREALDQLASSHIIEINVSLKEEPNTSKVERDLSKWYTLSGDTRAEENESTTMNCDSNNFSKLQILEKSCTADLFFKRY